MQVSFSEGGSFPGEQAAVVVLHGFTGSPASFIPQVRALVERGWRVEVPLLPGHGTTPEDLERTRFSDWWGSARESVEAVMQEGLPTFVVGLSMGGTLTLKASTYFPDLAGIVVINPAIEPPAESFIDLGRTLVDQGVLYQPSIGSDLAKSEVVEPAYDRTPIEAGLSLFGALKEVSEAVKGVKVPALLYSSRNDHVVPPSTSDYLVGIYGGPIERIWLERSYHVATLDYDADLISNGIIEWIAGILSNGS